jgi:hypothetical protein
MPLWHAVTLENVDHVPARNGTMKFTVDGGRPFRFQIPKGRVVFGGVSEYGSITIDVPQVFTSWWRETFEPALVSGLTPFNSNSKDSGLRVKVDKSTQFFNSKKEIQFHEVKEGLFTNATVTCIIEITGTYFFRESYGLTCRAYQIVVEDEVIEDPGETLNGFAFV